MIIEEGVYAVNPGRIKKVAVVCRECGTLFFNDSVDREHGLLGLLAAEQVAINHAEDLCHGKICIVYPERSL